MRALGSKQLKTDRAKGGFGRHFGVFQGEPTAVGAASNVFLGPPYGALLTYRNYRILLPVSDSAGVVD